MKMKKIYIAPTAELFDVIDESLLAEFSQLQGTTPWGDLLWGGLESGENPMYSRFWHNTLWDSDDDME